MLKLLMVLLALLVINPAAAARASYDAAFPKEHPYGQSYDPNVEAQLDRIQREREREWQLLEQYREEQRMQNNCSSDSCREVFEGRKWATEQEAKQRPR